MAQSKIDDEDEDDNEDDYTEGDECDSGELTINRAIWLATFEASSSFLALILSEKSSSFSSSSSIFDYAMNRELSRHES